MVAGEAEEQTPGEPPVFQKGSKEGNVRHGFMLKAGREQNQNKSFISAGLLALKKADAGKVGNTPAYAAKPAAQQ